MNTETEIYKAFEEYKECRNQLTTVERRALLTFYRKRLRDVRWKEKSRKTVLKLEEQIKEKNQIIQDILKDLLKERISQGKPVGFSEEEITEILKNLKTQL